MDYHLNERELMIRDLTRKIAQEKVLPVRAELDEKSEFPYEAMASMAQADLLRVFIPEEYEGLGGGCMEISLITEELSKVCAGVATTFSANALAAEPIIIAGSDEQKKKWLPPIASGEKFAAFALTELNAGSDAGGIQTTAQEDGDGYILNGTKQFITNGGEAEIYTVIARTDPKGAAWR